MAYLRAGRDVEPSESLAIFQSSLRNIVLVGGPISSVHRASCKQASEWASVSERQ